MKEKKDEDDDEFESGRVIDGDDDAQQKVDSSKEIAMMENQIYMYQMGLEKQRNLIDKLQRDQDIKDQMIKDIQKEKQEFELRLKNSSGNLEMRLKDLDHEIQRLQNIIQNKQKEIDQLQ